MRTAEEIAQELVGDMREDGPQAVEFKAFAREIAVAAVHEARLEYRHGLSSDLDELKADIDRGDTLNPTKIFELAVKATRAFATT